MDNFLPVMYDEWSDDLKLKAEKELNENEASMCEEIEELKKFLQKEGLLYNMDDSFLASFLRCKKHDVQRSCQQLKRYYEERHNLMAFYGFMFFKNIRVPIEQGICGVLPKRDQEGRVIMYIRLNQWSSEICDSDDVIRAIQSIAHFTLQFPATQVNGFCVIFDNRLASFDVLRLVLKYLRHGGSSINAFPARFQKVCVVNVNAVLRVIAPLSLAFMPSKLRARTTFHGDAETSLPKIFEPSILPEEFGGTMGPLNTLYQTWLEEFETYLPKLHATNKYYKRKNTASYPETENLLNDFSVPRGFKQITVEE